MGGSRVISALAVIIALLAAAAEATWCIARSGASTAALQTALDYACGSRTADCAPIQTSGLCYLPNTLAAHASYAFNSFYQRSAASPGACDFAGTATVTISDPSYGSCTFPSTPSTAGGSTSTSTPNISAPINPPITGFPMTPTPGFGNTGGIVGGTGGGVGGTGGSSVGGTGGGSIGGLTPGFGPPVPNYDTSSGLAAVASLVSVLSVFYALWLLL